MLSFLCLYQRIYIIIWRSFQFNELSLFSQITKPWGKIINFCRTMIALFTSMSDLDSPSLILSHCDIITLRLLTDSLWSSSVIKCAWTGSQIPLKNKLHIPLLKYWKEQSNKFSTCNLNNWPTMPWKSGNLICIIVLVSKMCVYWHYSFAAVWFGVGPFTVKIDAQWGKKWTGIERVCR